MGKFKVGDRVRRIEESMWPAQYGVVGEEYTVLGFSTNDALVIFEGCNGASPSAFELVEQPWQPKVGDRVRWREEFVSSLYTKDKVYEIKGFEHPNFILTDDQNSPRHTWTEKTILENFDLVPPLRIQAGKFYKTRDGRKVGPADLNPANFNIEEDRFGRKAFANLPEVGAVDANGIWLCGDGNRDEDLIAEWVDEPAVAVAATASNDNEAPAKFRVGDVVRLKCDGYAAEVGATAKIREVRSDGMIDVEWVRNELRNGQSDGGYYPDSFELATVAPQQSTAGFTIPLVDEEPANYNKLVVTLALDADDFHEELDEIIAKLKKIRKLQRRTGLAA